MWSDIDCADWKIVSLCHREIMLERSGMTLKSGLPFEYLVLSSRAIPALFTKRWMPLGSWLSTSLARRLISSFLEISPGRLTHLINICSI